MYPFTMLRHLLFDTIQMYKHRKTTQQVHVPILVQSIVIIIVHNQQIWCGRVLQGWSLCGTQHTAPGHQFCCQEALIAHQQTTTSKRDFTSRIWTSIFYFFSFSFSKSNHMVFALKQNNKENMSSCGFWISTKRGLGPQEVKGLYTEGLFITRMFSFWVSSGNSVKM